jgi:hypothetical protein
MTQSTQAREATTDREIALPDTDAADAMRVAKRKAQAAVLLAGHTTGIEGREDEFLRAVSDVLRTFDHTQGYEHEVNDGIAKMWLASLRFAKRIDQVDAWVEDSVDLMSPVLDRMAGIIRDSGEKDVALEAICGWSTCHHQLVLTETHKAPGKRWFLSPFKRVLDAGTEIGQFDFDEAYIFEAYYIPRAHGFAKRMGVEVDATFDPASRIFTISIVD